MGGHGLHSATVSGPAIFLSSWVRSLPDIASRNDYTSPADLFTCVPSLQQALNQAEQRLATLGVTQLSSLEEAIEEKAKFQAKRWKSEAYSRIATCFFSGAQAILAQAQAAQVAQVLLCSRVRYFSLA